MANDLLTASVIAKEALAILHEECNFLGSIKRTYEDEYSSNVSGYKKGASINIRVPARFTVTSSGVGLDIQDFDEDQVTLTVSSQPHVDVNFTSQERTMELSDFSDRVLRPAISQLASYVEADALGMADDATNIVVNGSSALTWKNMISGGAMLDQHAAPRSGRTLLVDPITQVNVVDATKGLFQDSTGIAEQYREGRIGRTGGFDWYSNARIPVGNTGTVTTALKVSADFEPNASGLAAISLYTSGVASQTIKKGQGFTVAGVYDVHPETRSAYGRLAQFVAGADATITSAGTSVTLNTTVYSSGAKKSISTTAAADDQCTPIGQVSTNHPSSLGYHKDAMAFACLPLIKPEGVDMAAVESFEGLSIRVVQQYRVGTDDMPARFDVLYGYKTLRPEWIVRYLDN